MKITVWCVLLCMLATGQRVNAQSKVTEQQKSEYAKGNQDPKFLKGYIDALKADGRIDELNDAVDRYLMVFPLNERYSGENLHYFIEDINSLNAKSFTGIIEHWKDISLAANQVEEVVKKINDVCKTTFFQTFFQEGDAKGMPTVDCSSLLAALKGSKIPVPETRRRLIEMWQNWREKKVDSMIRAFEQFVTAYANEDKEGALQLDLMLDGVVLGNILNYILEECNFEQCSKIFEVMEHAIEKNGRTGLWDLIGKSRDNFEGKKMMLELGEE